MADSHIPPHDLIAEECTLGAAMLSRPFAEELVASLSGNAFYKPAHRRIFDAIRRIVENTDDVPDAVAIALELGPQATEELGGRGELMRLSVETPAASAGPSYARTVEKHHRARRALDIAGRVTANIYEGAPYAADVEGLVDLTTAGEFDPAEASSYEVIDLADLLAGREPEVTPFHLRRDDGAGLVYPGRIHDIHAEPSVGKTWVALLLAKEVLTDGGGVVYLDYEDTHRGTVGRLLRIGTPAAAVGDPTQFAYINPAGAHDHAAAAALGQVLDEVNPDVVIVDGVAESLARNGYDENSNTDVLAWKERLLVPIVSAGAAVLLCDHVPKNADNRARGQRGAGAKLGLIDGASYELRLAQAYSKARAGLIRFIIAKDREGGVGPIGATAANLRITPRDDGATVELHLEEPPPPGEFQPTGIMEAISKVLEGSEQSVPESQIFDVAPGTKKHQRQALLRLSQGRYVDELSNPGGSKLYRSVKPYREADEHPPATSDDEDDTDAEALELDLSDEALLDD